MELGLDIIRRMTNIRQLWLMFFLGLLIGIALGYTLGSRGWVTVVDPNCDPASDPECGMVILRTDPG